MMTEETVDGFKLALVVVALNDLRRNCDPYGQCRQLTPEELDDLADYGWHLPDLKGRLAACVNAVRVRLRPQPSHRIEPSTVSSAAAPSQG
jgi:hypothetical protein